MKINDLELVIENLSGSYKKFAESLTEYPILGVTYPTHYGYIKGYKSEDGDDLDVFIGNGSFFGTLQVKRGKKMELIETKFILGVSQTELEEIKNQFNPMIQELKTFELEIFLEKLKTFKK